MNLISEDCDKQKWSKRRQSLEITDWKQVKIVYEKQKTKMPRGLFFPGVSRLGGRLTAVDRWRVWKAASLICHFACINHNSFSFFIVPLLSSDWYIFHLELRFIFTCWNIKGPRCRAVSGGDPAEGWVRWRGSWTTVRLRTGGKHKLSNHHLSALPKGLHLWNWWLNKSRYSESCNINTALKRKEGKKNIERWINF